MQSVLNNLITNSIVEDLKDDEYIKDNLVYCKLCNTPRSLFIKPPFDNKERLVRCICECQTKKRDDEERQEREFKRLNELQKLKVASLIGDRYKDTSFTNTEIGHNPSFDTAFIRCKRYCEVSREVLNKGLGIYIYGSKGTGKTHLTACMANELMNQMFQVLFTNFFEISKMIKGTWNTREKESDYIDRLANIDFLFIDDLGTERVSNGENDLWLQEKIFDVLNKRYNMQKPTIFTSNHSLVELINDRGFMDKTIDRIAEMSSAILKIEGESYRFKKRNQMDIPF